ncbi:FAD-dependent monooxygenase [Streptomyces sp. URMC 123]|uniref:FAD-dependent monooxygenase n=1 Tax=Streptomyces sp. URMC 123 TaxID=3423403 RepID=UPI003F1B42D2
MSKSVLISGASIAGPALAYWLGRYGFAPTVVELAPELRGGGQAVDFRGTTHLTVLERMGVLDELRAIQTGGSPIRFVDECGRPLLRLPGELSGGDVEVLRGDLARVLYEHSLPYTEYVFGDTITGLHETDAGVEVRFRHRAPRVFDLVIGADGLHSTVRRLAFGPEERYVRHLGHYAATWTLPNHLGVGREALAYNAPGRFASVGGDHRDAARAGAFFVFASPPLSYDRHDTEEQKALIAGAFAGLGWEVPRLLEFLRQAPEVYFDAISRVDVDRWSTGRIGLVGDAACGATLGGMGTGTAVVAAYVLAGELAMELTGRGPERGGPRPHPTGGPSRTGEPSPASGDHHAGGDHRAAFVRYESRLRGYAQGCQKGGDRTAKFLAPATSTGQRIRNGLLNRRLVLDWMLAAGKKATDSLDLPHYEALLGRPRQPYRTDRRELIAGQSS